MASRTIKKPINFWQVVEWMKVLSDAGIETPHLQRLVEIPEVLRAVCAILRGDFENPTGSREGFWECGFERWTRVDNHTIPIPECGGVIPYWESVAILASLLSGVTVRSNHVPLVGEFLRDAFAMNTGSFKALLILSTVNHERFGGLVGGMPSVRVVVKEREDRRSERTSMPYHAPRMSVPSGPSTTTFWDRPEIENLILDCLKNIDRFPIPYSGTTIEPWKVRVVLLALCDRIKFPDDMIPTLRQRVSAFLTPNDTTEERRVGNVAQHVMHGLRNDDTVNLLVSALQVSR